MAVGYPVIERWRVDLFFYICMAAGYPVIERWSVDSFFSILGCLLNIQ